jgi:hypothetical protein
MTSFNDYNRCIICGAVISDTNTTGVGFGCMANVVKPATRDCFRETQMLNLWIAKANYVRAKFISHFEGRKFRNEFKKSFFASMKTAERISKRQMDIMTNWLELERISLYTFNEIEIPMKDAFKPEVECPELYKERIDYHKKLYLSGKKDHKEDIAA